QQVLRREVSPDIWLAQHSRRRLCERVTALHDDEVGLAQGWIIERRVKQQRVAAALHVASTAAVEYVYVDDQSEAAGFAAYEAKQKILKQLVIARRRLAALYPSRVHASRVAFARFVKIQRAKIGDFKLDRNRACSFLTLESRRDDLRRVITERCGQRIHF